LLGHSVEAFPPNLDRAEAPWHPKPGNEPIEHIPSILAGMAHRGCYQRLALAAHDFVPAHHGRQHNARGVAVRNAEHRAQHIAEPWLAPIGGLCLIDCAVRPDGRVLSAGRLLHHNLALLRLYILDDVVRSLSKSRRTPILYNPGNCP
jgi:hypothetical protein